MWMVCVDIQWMDNTPRYTMRSAPRQGTDNVPGHTMDNVPRHVMVDAPRRAIDNVPGHFSHPILGTYEVIQFFELANLEGTPFQCGIWAPYQFHDTMGWKSHTISLSFQYHVTSYHTIGMIEAFQFQIKPYHHSKAVTGCLGSFFQNMKNISAGCNTGPLGSIFCGHTLQIFTDI